MKWISVTSIISAIAFFPTMVFSQPTPPDKTTFYCGIQNGVPATIARTPQGEIPMIYWNSQDLAKSETTPEQLCQEGSQRFQTYYENGQLNYITTGRMDGQTVACVAPEEDQACHGILFALNPTTKPRVALQRTFRVRIPSSDPINETNAPGYINLEQYFNGEYEQLNLRDR